VLQQCAIVFTFFFNNSSYEILACKYFIVIAPVFFLTLFEG